MAIYPKAIWRPLPENETEPFIDATQAILHSAVDADGPTSLWPFFRYNTSLESHFFIKFDGTVEQYIDTARQADANYKANIRAISIETEDDGDPNHTPWSPEQIDAILELLRWLNQEHGIPLHACPAWDKPGIGWHSMWGAPSMWTPARGKTCPGTIRIEQIHDTILPALMTTEENFLSALTDEQQKDLYNRVKRLTPFPGEIIDRQGNKHELGDPDTFWADPGVRWDIERTLVLRTVLDDFDQIVEEALAEFDVVDGPDAAEVATAVLTKLKERL